MALGQGLEEWVAGLKLGRVLLWMGVNGISWGRNEQSV